MTSRRRALVVVIALVAALSFSVGAGSGWTPATDRSPVAAGDDSISSRAGAAVGHFQTGQRGVLAAAREVRSTKAPQLAVLVFTALVALTIAAGGARRRSHEMVWSPRALPASALSRRGPPSIA